MKQIIAIIMLLCFGSLWAKAQVTDISTLDNVLYVSNTTFKPGQQLTVPVYMNNQATITGLQFDLILPDGFAVATDANGKPLISISTQRTTARKHMVSANLKENTYKVVVMSANNSSLSGTSGEVLNIAIQAPINLKKGDYAIQLNKQEMTTKYLEAYKVLSVESIFSIPYTAGDINNDGLVDIKDVSAMLKLICSEPGCDQLNKQAADLNLDTTVGIFDLTRLISIIK